MTGSTVSSVRERSITFDVMKAIGIIAVVFDHVVLGVSTAGFLDFDVPAAMMRFYLWYMPVFFFASGFFLERSLVRDGALRTIAKRALELLYPFFIWAALFGLTQYFAGSVTNTGPLPLSAVLTSLLPWAPREHMWFLPALLLALVISAVVFALARRAWRWVLLAAGVVMYALTGVFIDHRFALTFTIWVALAVLLASSPARTWLLSAGRRAWDILIALGAVVAFGGVTFVLIPTGWVDFEQVFTVFLCTALGVFAVIACSRVLAATSVGPLLAKVGGWSLHIYLTHVFVLAGARIALSRVLHVEDPLVIVLVSIPVCVVVGCLIGWAADRSVVSLLFQPPRGWTRRISRTATAPVVPDGSPASAPRQPATGRGRD